MESAEEAGPAEAPGAPASKEDKERSLSKSRRRRRWRKTKAKGERAGRASAPKEPWTYCGEVGTEWTDPSPRQVGGSMDSPIAALREDAGMT